MKQKMSKKVIYRQAMRKRVFVGVSLMMLVLFVLLSSLLLAANAQETAAETHLLQYTQKELAELVRDVEQQPREPDFSFLEEATGEFALPGEEQQASLYTGEALAQYFSEQLNGLVYLDTLVQDDGCVAVLALDARDYRAISLVVIAANPTAEPHAFSLQVEQYDEMAAEVAAYRLEPVSWEIPEPAEEEVLAESSEAADESELTEESSSPAEDVPEVSSSAEEPAQPTSQLPADEGQHEEQPAQQEEEAPPTENGAAEALAEAVLGAGHAMLGTGNVLRAQAEEPTTPPPAESASETSPAPQEPIASSVPAPPEETTGVQSQSGESVPGDMPPEEQQPVEGPLEATFAVELEHNDSYATTGQGVTLVLNANGTGTIRLFTGPFNAGPHGQPEAPAGGGMIMPMSLPMAGSLGGGDEIHLYSAGEGETEHRYTTSPTFATYNTFADGEALDIAVGDGSPFVVGLFNEQPIRLGALTSQAERIEIVGMEAAAAAQERQLQVQSIDAAMHLKIDKAWVTAEGAIEVGGYYGGTFMGDMYVTNSARVESKDTTGAALTVRGSLVMDDGNTAQPWGDFSEEAVRGSYATYSNWDMEGKSRIIAHGGSVGAQLGHTIVGRGSVLFAKADDGTAISLSQTVGADEHVGSFAETLPANGAGSPAMSTSAKDRMGGTIIAEGNGSNGFGVAGHDPGDDSFAGIRLFYQKLYVCGQQNGIYLQHSEAGLLLADSGSEVVAYGIDASGIRLQGLGADSGETGAAALYIRGSLGTALGPAGRVLGVNGDPTSGGNTAGASGIETNKNVFVAEGGVLSGISSMNYSAYRTTGGTLPSDRSSFFIPDAHYFIDGWLFPATSTGTCSNGISLTSDASAGYLKVSGNNSQVYAFGGRAGVSAKGLVDVSIAANPDDSVDQWIPDNSANVSLKAYGSHYGIISQVGVRTLPVSSDALPGAYVLGSGQYNGIRITAETTTSWAGFTAVDSKARIHAGNGWIVGETDLNVLAPSGYGENDFRYIWNNIQGYEVSGGVPQQSTVENPWQDAGQGLSVGGGFRDENMPSNASGSTYGSNVSGRQPYLGLQTRNGAKILADVGGGIHEVYHGSVETCANAPADAVQNKQPLDFGAASLQNAGDSVNIGTLAPMLANMGVPGLAGSGAAAFQATTPANAPSPGYAGGSDTVAGYPAHYDYLNYKPDDDQNLTTKDLATVLVGNEAGGVKVLAALKPGQALVLQSVQDLPYLIGNGGVSSRYFASEPGGTVRITLFPVGDGRDIQKSMDVDVELWNRDVTATPIAEELLAGQTELLQPLEFKLSYWPVGMSIPHVTTISSNAGKLLADEGVIALGRLRPGTYQLEPSGETGKYLGGTREGFPAVVFEIVAEGSELKLELNAQVNADKLSVITQKTTVSESRPARGYPTFFNDPDSPDYDRDGAKVYAALKAFYQTKPQEHRGTLTVRMDVTGLWAGHDDAVFLVEARGIDGDAKGRIFFEKAVVSFDNLIKPFERGFNPTQHQTPWTEHVLNYQSDVRQCLVEFDNMPTGTYSITVHPAMRTEPNGDTATKNVELRWEDDGSGTFGVRQYMQGGTNAVGSVQYAFKCTNYLWMSGGDAVTNRGVRLFNG